LKVRTLAMAALGALVLGASGAAFAQLTSSEVIEARHNGFQETGAAFKSINDQLRSSTPVKFVIQRAARTIAANAHAISDWFPAGSGPGPSVDTKARASIWSDAAAFQAAQANVQHEADLMTQVAAGADFAAMRTQARALGAACAACHHQFREDD